MAKHTKEELAEINKQINQVFELLLKKTGTNKSTLYRLAKENFIASNLDELTDSEKKQFDKLVF